MVKNLPAMQETRVGPLGWEDPLGGNGNPVQYSYLGNPMDRGAWKTIVHGVTRVEHDLATKQSQHKVSYTARATSNHSISVV